MEELSSMSSLPSVCALFHLCASLLSAALFHLYVPSSICVQACSLQACPKSCLEALRRCTGPPDTSRHPKSCLETLRRCAGPPDTSRLSAALFHLYVRDQAKMYGGGVCTSELTRPTHIQMEESRKSILPWPCASHDHHMGQLVTDPSTR